LERLINDPKVIIVGQNAQVDIDEIWWAQKPLAPRVEELTTIMPACGCRGRGIPVYTAALLGMRMSKEHQRSNWMATPLSVPQQQYAAMDAWTARAVFLAAHPPYLQEARNRRPAFFTSPTTPPPTLSGRLPPQPPLDPFVLPGARMEDRNRWEVLATIRKPMVVKWAKFLHLDQVNTSTAPHILVTQGHTLQEDLHLPLRPPSWIIIDGGCLHNSTVQVLVARGYYKWGVHASVSAWAAHLDDNHTLLQYGTLDSFAAAFLRSIQKDIQKSYFSIGGSKFRTGYVTADFALDTIQDILPNPATVTSKPSRSDWRLSYTRRCPLEPATSALPLDDPQITGIESSETVSKAEELDRAQDLALWKQSGQLWIDAFLPPARKRVLTFLNDNAQANATVARSAETWSSRHAAPFAFGTVADLKVTQAELRPGARGQLWRWRNGRCTATTFEPITDQVAFKVQNVRQACQTIRFRDNRALQMLTVTGASHMTDNFPLTSLASRNHQGAAHFPAVVTALMIDKVQSGDVEEISPGCFATAQPTSIPFCIMPVNGSEANLKEEQYFNQLAGRDFKPNVRPTFDGSSPHSETGDSINERTVLPPELETEWSSGTQVEESYRVLLSIGCTIMGMKIDLAKSYFQIWQQLTQLWRQQTYHVHSVDGKILGGYMSHLKLLWGVASAATIFNRTITTITVKYVEHCLWTKWVPTIECPMCIQWIADRKAAGITDGRDLIPGFISAFLDDSCIFLGGTDADRNRGREVVLSAYAFLGWTISQPKMVEEGSLDSTIVVLGHGFDLRKEERFVTKHKISRIRTGISKLAKASKVSKLELASLLGLIQSVRANIARRWRLSPLYGCLHGPVGNFTVLSQRARACLRRVDESLEERRSVWTLPPRWEVPSFPLVNHIPNVDAAEQSGLGGVMIVGTKLLFFARKWSASLKLARIGIAPLEALAVVTAAAVWGPSWSGRNVVLRSDSTDACFALNTLKTRNHIMEYVVDLWEDIQFRYGFNGVVTHCPQGHNRIADLASRRAEDKSLPTRLLAQ
jgi:hypothetical protein